MRLFVSPSNPMPVICYTWFRSQLPESSLGSSLVSVLTMDEVPIKERLQAADASIERQRNIQAANRTLTTTLNQLSESYVKDIQSLITKTQLRAYISRHNETRKSIEDIPTKYRSTTDGLRQEKEFRRSLVKKSQEYVATLGVDVKKAEGIQKDYIKRPGEALRQQLEPKEEAPYVILDPKETPRETHNPGPGCTHHTSTSGAPSGGTGPGAEGRRRTTRTGTRAR